MCIQFIPLIQRVKACFLYFTFALLCSSVSQAQISQAQNTPSISLSCVDCHREALSNQKLPFTQKAQCTPCHQKSFQPLLNTAQQNDSYLLPQKNNSFTVPRHTTHMYQKSSILQGRVLFNHKDHLLYGMSCERCHVKPTHVKPTQFKPEVTSYLTEIQAENCVQCHQSKKASIQCHTCHESTALGKLRIRWYNGTQQDLIPKTLHSKMIHFPNYAQDHKIDALSHAQDCLQCHQQSSCDQCHSTGRNRLQVHSPFYIKLHGLELQGQKSTRDCQSCHEPTRFCAPCHQRSGLHTRASTLSFAQLGIQKISFHRPGFAQIQHGIEASRDLGQCISCHSERDCMACHSSDDSLTKRKTQGRLVNPHHKNPCLIPKRASDLACKACHMNRSHQQLCR
jgi:hypothetical protein